MARPVGSIVAVDKLMAEDPECLICVEPRIGELVSFPPTLMRQREAVGRTHSHSLSPRERRCP